MFLRAFFPIVIFWLFTVQLFGQCDPLVINISDSVCLNEEVLFDNQSNPGISFEWDFCPNSTINDIVSPRATSVTNPYALDHIIENGVSYAFVVGSSDNLVRIKFINGLLNVTQKTDLGNIGGVLENPQGISLYKESGNWYAIVANQGGEVFLLDFGADIENNTPSITQSIDLSSVGSLRGLTVEEQDNEVFALLTGGGTSGELVILNFGSSILNVPVVQGNGINLPSFPTAISMLRDCEEWYGVTTSNNGNTITKLIFGNSLSNTPTTQTVAGLTKPTGISLIKDLDSFYAFTNTETAVSAQYRIEFGKDFTSGQADIFEISRLLSNRWAFAFQVVKVGPLFYHLAAGTSNLLIVSKFDENCNSVSTDYSTDFEPTGISYSDFGWKTIEIRATDTQGKVIIIADSVFVSRPLSSNFAFTNNCEFEPTLFTDNSFAENTIMNWSWDFDDPSSGSDNTSSLQNPVHSFTAPGDYLVQLQITDKCGVSDTTISIKVFANNDLQPDFITSSILCTNQNVDFTDASATLEETIVAWFWDFGDPGSGAENTSTLQNPTHSFSTAGSYDVALTITGGSGCQQTIVNPGGNSIMVVEGPSANFTFQNSCAQQSVQFTDLSTGVDIISWDWDFGNGTISNLQNPLVFFNEAGEFEVSLTIENLQGCRTSISQTITIHGIPQVAFSSDLACNAEMTQFFDLTVIPNANPVAWDWHFGDNSTANVQNPLHQFTDPGDYTVQLIVTSNFGCRDSLTQVITVNPSPLAAFSYNTVCSGETVFFQDQSSAGDGLSLVDWLWQVDGQILTEQNPEVTFNSSGDFLVELTVTSENLCTHTISQIVSINPSPFIDFEVQNACNEDFTTFQNLSTPGTGDEIVEYLWDFDGLGSSTVQSPRFVFNSPGSYQVSLRVFTENNCEVSLSKAIIVDQSPSAVFEPSISIGSPPMLVEFSNNSLNSGSFFWDFGNGNSSTEFEPSETFQTTGDFEVMLVSRNNLCTDTIIQVIRVLDPVLDVSLDALDIVENNGSIKLQATLSNRGSVIITDMEMFIDLGGLAQVSESFSGSLAVGEDLVYTLNTSPIFNQGINYVCVRLAPFSEKTEELVLDNNRECANESDLFIQLDPYPNPASDILTLGYITPSSGSIEIFIYDLTGKEIKSEVLSVLSPGLDSYSVDVSQLDRGVYVVRSRFGSVTRTIKIMLN